MELVDDEENQDLSETNHYNFPHEIKPGVRNRFNIVLKCVLERTAIDRKKFKDLLLKAISTHKGTRKEGTPHYT